MIKLKVSEQKMCDVQRQEIEAIKVEFRILKCELTESKSTNILARFIK